MRLYKDIPIESVIDQFTKKILKQRWKLSLENPHYLYNEEEILREIAEDSAGCKTLDDFICQSIRNGVRRCKEAKNKTDNY